MNGYEATRAWYNFKFDNPSQVKHIHSDFYFYLLDQWNRLGQKKEFGLPTQMTMEALGIGSYNTYKKALNDLVDFSFVKIVSESKNQHQSKIVALSKIDKATDKALDKATIKATDKATDTIIEQETIEQKTIKDIPTKSDVCIDDKQSIYKERIKNFDYNCTKLLEFYNSTFGKQSRVVNAKVKTKLKTVLKDYDWKDIGTAMIHVRQDEYHKQHGYKWATLDFFTRADKIEMYAFKSAFKDEYQGEDAGLIANVMRQVKGQPQ
jgi:hypothetical protein